MSKILTEDALAALEHYKEKLSVSEAERLIHSHRALLEQVEELNFRITTLKQDQERVLGNNSRFQSIISDLESRVRSLTEERDKILRVADMGSAKELADGAERLEAINKILGEYDAETDPREVHDNGKPVYVYVRVDPAAPTVESALAELREMFPYNEVAVVHKRGWLVSGLRPWISYHIRIGDPVIAEADSLAKAMAQVRQWKEKQDTCDCPCHWDKEVQASIGGVCSRCEGKSCELKAAYAEGK